MLRLRVPAKEELHNHTLERRDLSLYPLGKDSSRAEPHPECTADRVHPHRRAVAELGGLTLADLDRTSFAPSTRQAVLATTY